MNELPHCVLPCTCACRGARVHSDSWTTSASVYDTNSQSVDLFSWLFQDFLPVFAAGNYGARLVDGTIASPSTAKNCISVGAALLGFILLAEAILHTLCMTVL